MIRGRTATVWTTVLVVTACTSQPDSATTSPRSGGRSVTASGFVASTSGVDSLLRHADSVYLRAPDSSTALYRIALDRSESLGDSAGMARSLTGLGQAARQTGELRASREFGERALALKLRLGMRADYFRSYNALGLLARDDGRLSDAVTLLTQAAAAASATHDSVALAKVEVNRGLVLGDLGDFDGARAALVAGRDRTLAAGDSITLGRVLNNIAALDITLGNPLPALASLEAARRLIRITGDSIGEVNALVHPEDIDLYGLAAPLTDATATLVDHAFRMRHANGNWVWLRARCELVQQSGDSGPHLIGSAVDITEQKTLVERIVGATIPHSRYLRLIGEAEPERLREPRRPGQPAAGSRSEAGSPHRSSAAMPTVAWRSSS